MLSRMKKQAAILIILLVVVAAAAWAQTAAGDRKTVWSGVYTAEEATRGQAAFVRSCSGCHGAQGDYRQMGAAFQGNAFMERWRESNVGSLFTIIRDTMPRDSPGFLDDRTYLDIVARMLQVNSFPPGMEELTVEGIRKIQIEGKDGPKPVPNGAIVQLVGCLTQDDTSAWIITKGSEPARTDRIQGSTDEELEQAKAKPTGDYTFQLLDINALAGFEPDSHKGHKIQAKGYLRRLPDRQRIDLTSMEMIAAECSPAQ
jgi:S-disulfanyl-L-cysteine oxidoreductase SoxD